MTKHVIQSRISSTSSFAMILLGFTFNAHAGSVLSGDEIKALITNKTIQVTVIANGSQWRQFYADDGSSLRHPSGEKSTWSVENGKHCNSSAQLLCAAIKKNDDGTYSRLKENGDPAVTWTNIVDGKQF